MSEQLILPPAIPKGLPSGMDNMPMTRTVPEYGVGVQELSLINPIYDQLAAECETPGQLRDSVYAGMYSELQSRVASNPNPTEQEMQMGTYEEGIEPQARDAVMAMRDKGYNTLSSGFENEGEWQGVNFDVPLSEDTITLLSQHGFVLGTTLFYDTDNPARGTWRAESAAHITFKPENPMDLLGMKAKWDELASILPDLGRQAPPATHGFAIEFRKAVESNSLQDYVEGWGYKPAEPSKQDSSLAEQDIPQDKNTIPQKTAISEKKDETVEKEDNDGHNSVTERLKIRAEKKAAEIVTSIGEKAIENMLIAEHPEYSIAIKLALLDSHNEKQE